jgi:hypothetical protein
MADLSPATVVFLALGLVVAINGLLILSLTRGGLQRQVELMRTAARAAQSPWKTEDEALSELHRRVVQLSEDQTDAPR